MKVNEIVREERLDEALPLIAGLSIPMILSAVAAGLKAMSVYEMYDVLSKNNYDIDNMSEDEQTRLFVDFIILFVPGGGSFANATIMKILPAWVKQRGAKMVRDKLVPLAYDLRKMKNDNRKKYADRLGTSPSQAAKNQKALKKANKKADSDYRAAGKQLAAEKLKDVAYPVIGILAAMPLVYTYYGKLDELDKQYSAHKEGDTTTEIFGDMDHTQAWKTYNDLRNKYIGELTIGIGAALARTPIGKKVEAFSKLIPIIKWPAAIGARLLKIGGPALTVLMQTEQGQQFLSNAVVEMITKGVGALTSGTINILAQGLDIALGAVGVDSNLQQYTKPQAPHPSATVSRQDRLDIYGLKIYANKSNPNIKYIGGQQVTGPDGYLKNNIPNIVKNIANRAKGAGVANPLDQIQKNPNLTYPEY